MLGLSWEPMPFASRALVFVGLCAGLCACGRTPQHRLDFLDAGELGAVRITEQVLRRIEVENTGREPVMLEAVALEAGWGGVLTVDPGATGCVPGLTLLVGERCSIGVVFEPGNDVSYGDSLHVDYRPEVGTDPLRATLRVSGVGRLDCSLRPEFASSFDEGVAEADAQIAIDVPGDASGERRRTSRLLFAPRVRELLRRGRRRGRRADRDRCRRGDGGRRGAHG